MLDKKCIALHIIFLNLDTLIIHSLQAWVYIVSHKTGPLLFLQYFWVLLTSFNNFFITTIRNDQHEIWNKTYHLTLAVLPHYRVKYQ